MKKYLLPAFAFLLIVANVSSVSPTRAQMHASTTVSTDAGATLPISVNIPEQWKTAIVREDGNGVVTFGLANENSAPFFLFSVTEIPDQLWGKTKMQVPDASLIAQKNGMIYYSQKTTKERIKGPQSELYQQIYLGIDQMIASVQVK